MNLLQVETIGIEKMIFIIRGKQVMLDSDLAKLYKCTNGTKDINKSVNRNLLYSCGASFKDLGKNVLASIC